MIAATNHPAHLLKSDGKMSKSAFLPFCDFGGNLSVVGVKIEQFEIPVCNIFEAKVLIDQICYEVDLQKLSDKDNIEHELKSGFAFIMDYNEDRQVTFDADVNENDEKGLINQIVKSDDNQQALIYLNTIGKTDIFKYI